MGQEASPAFVPLCGIGTSAGGVPALQTLFRALPPDLGIAYVVILHLAPDLPSSMKAILENATKMQVHQVRDHAVIQPNCVYVIAPDRELFIEGDDIKARPFSQSRGSRMPIDSFFRSIAAGRGDGIAVILTGAGSDGMLGANAIKEGGGVVFVQEPADAEFKSMPNNAIAAGVADFIAPIAGLAERIVEVARSKEAVRSLDQDGAANEIRRIVSFLHARTGHDFSSYKRATVMRRIMRRMQLRRAFSLDAYMSLLQSEPEEANELFRDMLISVTQFFRDPDAFEQLAKQAIGPLFDDLEEEGLRVWVPGCATGEEAYSIAILIREEAERRKVSVPVQIFATDLDDGALATAREGLYPTSVEQDLTEERQRRFFFKEGSHLRVRKEIRDMLLFATHSVLKDPPFLRLDLISCRNLMIYLERGLQTKLCQVFAYGLRPNRYLFLGSAETADAASDQFSVVDREARIYRSRPHAASALPIISNHSGRVAGQVPLTPRPSGERPEEQPLALHISAVEAVAPPSALVDDNQNILHLSASAGRFILHSGGPFSGRLSTVVHPELRLDLEHALDRAFSLQASTLTLAVPVAFNGTKRRIAMNVTPVPTKEGQPHQALVFFLDGGATDAEPEDLPDSELRPDDFKRLHAELKSVKEALARSRRDHELSVQELRAANEELQSTNEEYRSTAEELETSREELQSMNEELQTVNTELKSKLESISSAHNDLRNLTAATEIGTMFLDQHLRIRMFTPPISELFNITDSDIGRPITDFTHRLAYDGIEGDIRTVLRELAPKEAEVECSDGRWLMMRLRPYRTIEDRIEGAVVSFVDITSRRAAQQQLIDSERRYRSLFDSIDQGFCVVEVMFDASQHATDYRFLEVNRAFETQSGIANAAGRTMREIEPLHEDYWFEAYGRVALSRQAEHFEAKAEQLHRFFEVHAFPFGSPEDRQIGVLFHDITNRKQAEAERELMTQELSHRVKNTLAVVQSLARQTSRETESIEKFSEIFMGRLQALSQAHSLLLATQWRSASLEGLVRLAVKPCGAKLGETISISGPEVQLTAKQALGLSLVLHELMTNAVRHGSLSFDGGSLAIGWSQEPVEGGMEVLLTWVESGGPPVKPPSRQGFGTTLIERVCQVDLQGKAELIFKPEGFTAELCFPA